MFNSIGNSSSGIGSPISPNQIGGEDFIRHCGADKLIYRFKEGSGTTVRDDSHNSNNGTFGATTAAPTWKRNSLYFDGGDYVDLTGITHGISTGGFTFCFSLNTFTDGDLIIDQENARFYIYNFQDEITSPNSTFIVSDTGISSIMPIIFQITRDSSGNIECYVNGKIQKKGVSNTSDFTYDGISTLNLGCNIEYGGCIIGTMYSFRILNKGLSGIECFQEYLCNKWLGNN